MYSEGPRFDTKLCGHFVFRRRSSSHTPGGDWPHFRLWTSFEVSLRGQFSGWLACALCFDYFEGRERDRTHTAGKPGNKREKPFSWAGGKPRLPAQSGRPDPKKSGGQRRGASLTALPPSLPILLSLRVLSWIQLGRGRAQVLPRGRSWFWTECGPVWQF